jgi:hypothetical protein
MSSDDLVFAAYELLDREGPLTKPQIAARLTNGDVHKVDAAVRTYRLMLYDSGPALLESGVGQRQHHVYWLSRDPREIKQWGVSRLREHLTRALVTGNVIEVGLRYADDDSLEGRQLRHIHRRVEFTLDELRDAAR